MRLGNTQKEKSRHDDTRSLGLELLYAKRVRIQHHSHSHTHTHKHNNNNIITECRGLTIAHRTRIGGIGFVKKAKSHTNTHTEVNTTLAQLPEPDADA